MGTEIGARNLADVYRYDLVPVVADRWGSTPLGSGRCGATGCWSS
jgi:nitric oxide synthase oxygenase domain/subunit